MKDVGCNLLTDDKIRGSALLKGASEEIPVKGASRRCNGLARLFLSSSQKLFRLRQAAHPCLPGLQKRLIRITPAVCHPF
jgi:hypothetical protein